jgi:hypothetical protein
MRKEDVAALEADGMIGSREDFDRAQAEQAREADIARLERELGALRGDRDISRGEGTRAADSRK